MLTNLSSSYFKDIDRLFRRDFIPTDQDILRARLRTTGISETIFDLGQLTYKMFDVGGQRSERKKWIHVFDNVQVVLFLAAISGYDQVLVEDRNGVSVSHLAAPIPDKFPHPEDPVPEQSPRASTSHEATSETANNAESATGTENIALFGTGARTAKETTENAKKGKDTQKATELNIWSKQNQMQEAFGLFEAIANSRWFEHSAMILFLNKIDLFREKIESGKAPVGNFYPDYQGGAYDVGAGQQFFADRFRSYVRQPNKETYVHFTNATDTDLLKKTMASVQDMIIQRNLNNLIL